MEIIGERRRGSREKWAGRRYENSIPFHTLVSCVVRGYGIFTSVCKKKLMGYGIPKGLITWRQASSEGGLP